MMIALNTEQCREKRGGKEELRAMIKREKKTIEAHYTKPGLIDSPIHIHIQVIHEALLCIWTKKETLHHHRM